MISRRADACTRLSADNGESLHGLAPPTAQAFLAVEETASWGRVGARRSERLPVGLRERCGRLGITPLLIRRLGRYDTERRTVLVAWADYHSGWVGRVSVDDPGELGDLDLDALAAGRLPAGVGPHHEPVVLACTHGTVDACCAELGRPVARALEDAFDDAVWQTSHVGGCRFAANTIVLPRALMLGRLSPDTAVEAVGAAIAGRVPIDHYRGRPGAARVVQVAEAHLRRRLGIVDLDAIEVLEHRTGQDAGTEEVRLRAGDRTYTLTLRTEQLAPRPKGCGNNDPFTFEQPRVLACAPSTPAAARP